MASRRFTQSIGVYSHASLNDGVHSEKCNVRRFHRCVNVIECTYTNQYSVAYNTPRPYDMILYTWSDNKVRELIVVKVLHTSLLNTTLSPSK